MRENIDQHVTAKTAILAKEKGFNLECTDCYCISAEYEDKENEKGRLIPILDSEPFDCYTGLVPDYSEFLCYRPTQTLLSRWIREKHGIAVIVDLDCTLSWIWKIIPLHPEASTQRQCYSGQVWCDIPENALEDGLYNALELIKT
jgi:hypothetical protein